MDDDKAALYRAIAKGLKDRRNRMWEDSIKKALKIHGNGNPDIALERIAQAVITQAIMGEKWAVQEIGDRLDGKAKQQIDVGVAEDVPAGLKVTFHGRDDTDRVSTEARVPLSS